VAKTLNRTQSADLTAQNTYTEESPFNGTFGMRIRGTWAGTLTLQRSDDNGTNWDDIESFSNNQLRVVLEPANSGGMWRIGFKSGEYTSGTASVRLG